ncbi:hypothetical protein [Actinomyces ruminis]|uniref:hypothetical protein n=1 Tax=Actinomyces ruminis TaxID=1937003 RepID=UPI000B657611|nr:hypothetical protein [Actinomyces ruminis]
MTTQSEAPTTTGAQVPLKEKISYGFAEFGSQFIWTTVGSYLMTFYTDVASFRRRPPATSCSPPAC